MKKASTRWGLFGVVAGTLFTTHALSKELVPFDASWRYLSPQSDAEDPQLANPNFNDNWFKSNFNVNSWAGPAPGPFAWPGPDDGPHIAAFTPGDAAFVREAQTFLTRPETGQRYSVYFRTNFTTTAPANNLAVEVLADDGGVLYIDGNQVGMLNCCQTAAFGDNSAFTDLTSGTGNETSYLLAPLGNFTLPAGNHTMAVMVLSAATDSSDMGFSMRLLSNYIEQDLITSGSDWNYFKGTEEPSGGTLNWTTAAFNDNDWSSGPDGFGYERDGVDGVLTNDLVKTVFDDMEGNYSTAYLRKDFTVTDPNKFAQLDLLIDYDDAFVAYINGKQVAASTFDDPDSDPTTGLPFDTIGQDINADHESTNGSGAAGTRFTIDLAQFPGLLKSGAGNVLAIQGINRADSSDFALAQLQLIGINNSDNSNPSVAGDFNQDGQLTATDIDTLSAAIRAADSRTQFDLNKDGRNNTDDHTYWVEELKKTYFGDSNLDGEFNTRDFVQVFQFGEFEDGVAGNSTWEEGDWTGDGDFSTADFVAAFQSGSFENGPRQGVAAVPEPASIVLIGLSLAGLLGQRRRHAS